VACKATLLSKASYLKRALDKKGLKEAEFFYLLKCSLFWLSGAGAPLRFWLCQNKSQNLSGAPAPLKNYFAYLIYK
jgi:hypothetical protein